MKMRDAVVLGTGGHSRVVISLLKANSNHKILSVLELGRYRQDDCILDIPVQPVEKGLGSYVDNEGIDFYLAIGDSAIRKHWYEKLRGIGFTLPNLVSRHAEIDVTASIGTANVICSGAFIGPQAQLGNNNLINTGSIIEHEVVISDHCHIAPSVTISGRTRVADQCFIGVGSTIIEQMTVASETMLAAGAVLTMSVEQPGRTYMGVPARLKKEVP